MNLDDNIRLDAQESDSSSKSFKIVSKLPTEFTELDNIEISGIKLALQHITSTSSVTTANSLTVKMISSALDMTAIDTAALDTAAAGTDLDLGGAAAEPGTSTYTLDDAPYLSSPP